MKGVPDIVLFTRRWGRAAVATAPREDLGPVPREPATGSPSLARPRPRSGAGGLDGRTVASCTAGSRAPRGGLTAHLPDRPPAGDVVELHPDGADGLGSLDASPAAPAAALAPVPSEPAAFRDPAPDAG